MQDNRATLRTKPSIDELLEHLEWVRALALRLAGDGAEADDVVQDAWLTTLRTPPASRANLRGWFSELVRNCVRQRRRTDRRRRRRETEASRSEALPPSSELVERAEASRQIVDLVLALREPWRDVVLLRFFEGVSTREIAARRGIPHETVRTQLRRALATIRSRLEARRGSDWKKAVWIVGAGPTHSTAVSAGAGAFLLMAKSKLVVGLIVCALTFFGVTALWPDAPPREVVAAPELAPKVRADTVADSRVRAPGAERHAQPGSSEVRSTPRVLHGFVNGLRPEVPWTTSLTIEPVPQVDAARPQRVVASLDKKGAFRVDVAALWHDRVEAFVVVADDPRYLRERREVRPGVVRESKLRPIEVTVRCAAVLRGVVRDVTTRAVVNARIAVFPMRGTKPVAKPVQETWTDAKGNYRVKTSYHGPCIVVAGPPAREDADEDEDEDEEAEAAARPRCFVPRSVATVVTVGLEVEVPPHILEAGHEITGTVRWPDGTPVPHTTVHVNPEGARAALHADGVDWLWWANGELADEDAEARTDTSGRFRFRGLPSQEFELRLGWIQDHVSFGAAKGQVVKAPARGVVIEIAAATLQIAVQTSDGRSARAHVGVHRGRHLRKSSVPKGRPMKLALAAKHRYRIEVTARGYETEAFDFEPAAATNHGTRTITLRPKPSRRVLVELRGTPPVPLARFEWHRLDVKADSTIVDVEAKAGKFVFEDLAAGRYELRVGRPRAPANLWESYLLPMRTNVDVAAAGDTQVALEASRGGRLRIRAVDRSGVFYGGEVEIRRVGGKPISVRFLVGGSGGYVRGRPGALLDRGVNEARRAFAPGRYIVTVSIGKRPPVRRYVDIVQREVATVEIDVR